MWCKRVNKTRRLHHVVVRAMGVIKVESLLHIIPNMYLTYLSFTRHFILSRR